MASTYHLMRNFIAVMRSLGYPRLISIENFRNPNFPLMADVLVFLLKKYDPSIDIETKIDSENERLKFVLTASQLMVNKANLDINVKKLYMADVNSVQEMIKLAKLIQLAWTSLDQKKDAIIEEENIEDTQTQPNNFNNRTALMQFNSIETSQITSEIYQVATKLYDAVTEYDQNKEQLQKTLNKQLNIEQIEQSLRQSIQQLQQNIVEMQNKIVSLNRDNEDLNGKIEKKNAELNRNKKRLQTLYAQRPGYMDELEKIELDIAELYDKYVTSSRCFFFLKQKLEEFEEFERLKIEERNKEIKQMLDQIQIDDFLKNNKDMKLYPWNGGDERATNGDDLAMFVDVDEDASGRISGSDFSDKDINEIPRSNDSRRERRKSTNKSRVDKNSRLLLANTVTVKSLRSPINNHVEKVADSTMKKSMKSGKIFSYGSLVENDDDEDDDSKSETNLKMSDSEIDLDAIEDSDDDSINSTELNLKPDIKTNDSNNINSNSILNINNLDKADDNF